MFNNTFGRKSVKSAAITITLILIVILSGNIASAQEAAQTLYVLAAPFTTLNDSIDREELLTLDPLVFPGGKLIAGLDETIADKDRFLDAIGLSKQSINVVRYRPIHEAISASVRTGRWIILPFDQLDPRLKVIAIDGASPIRKDFDPYSWPLTVRESGAAEIDWETVPFTNYDAEKISDVMLTGVTALVRAVANYMDGFGADFPAVYTGDYLRSADILHINNEVPFARICQQTAEQLNNLVFCSKERYLDLLLNLGTTVVEIDGDHFQDFGDDAVYYTLELYEKAGLPYYGGGRNLAEAQKPFLVEHNGNKFAFLGCNGKEAGYAAASETRPGAGLCDYPLMEKRIRELRADGYLPIVTLQHIEYYRIAPNDQMAAEYGRLADAGAVIVSGSQSHLPMAFDITPDRVIHYGLGNLFFDQAYYLPETAEATIDRYIFYDNRLISLDVATIKFINLAQNDWMTPEERAGLLDRIFAESIVRNTPNE